jgi:hypothetical protein|tara:strand:- start:136 stop:390 length:255 start_codon:yes stop_codon:yes gene_type:complete
MGRVKLTRVKLAKMALVVCHLEMVVSKMVLLVSHLSASSLTESAWWRKPRNNIVPCTRKQAQTLRAPGAQTYMHTGSEHTCLEE